MRVLMVSPHLPPDQAANALLPATLARELSRSGVEVTLAGHLPAVAEEPGSGEHGPAKGAGALGKERSPTSSAAPRPRVLEIPRRGRGRFARTPVGGALAALRMAIRLRGPVRRADVVHLHSNGLVVEVAGLLAERWGAPFVITLYGTDVWHHNPSRHRRFARVVGGAAQRIFYSYGLLDFGRDVGLATGSASVIYAPVGSHFQPATEDERRATRAELGIYDEPLLVTVKRLHPVAGHADLLRAMRSVLDAGTRAHLLLIGDGPLRASLEQLAADLDLGRQVRFLGTVPNARVARYLAAADLFVLPSRLESWGTVMLEALACGTPVVATPTAGAVEVMRLFPRDVRVADGRDPAALTAAMVPALGARCRVSEEARRQLRERFSPEACAAAYLAAYEQARSSRSRSEGGPGSSVVG